MKTHIIQIQPEDDWRSAAARLPRAAGDRALLVWPEEGGPEPVEAALRILRRRARRRTQGLAVASEQRPVALAAEGLGLPAFADAQEAGRAEWAVSEDAEESTINAAELRAQAAERRQLAEPAKLTIRLAWFSIGVLAFLISAVLLLG